MTPNMQETGVEVSEPWPIQLKGSFKLEAYKGDIVKDEHGNILNERAIIPEWGDHTYTKDNLIVTVGKELMLDRLFGLSSWAALTQMGVGTSGTAAAVGNTDLTGGVWKNFDATPIRTSLTVRAIVTFGTSEANINWQEMAVRTVSPSNKILNRVAPIGPFNKTTAVSIILTYDLTQG